MKLLFSNSYGIERVIGEPNCLSEATRIISDFLEEHNMTHLVKLVMTDCLYCHGLLDFSDIGW